MLGTEKLSPPKSQLTSYAAYSTGRLLSGEFAYSNCLPSTYAILISHAKVFCDVPAADVKVAV